MPTQVQIRGAVDATQSARTFVSRELDANITYKRINLSDGTTPGGIPHLNYSDAINQTFTYAAASGTNAITMSLAVAPTAYAAGQKFVFKAAATNTGSATLNVNSLGAKTLKKKDVTGGTLSTLSAGDIISGGIYTAFYDGTDMILESVDSGGGADELISTITASASSTIDFEDVFTSSYDYYYIILSSITLSTTAALTLRYQTSTGPAGYDTSNYNDSYLENGTGGSNSAASYISLTGTTASADAISGKVEIQSPLQTDGEKMTSFNTIASRNKLRMGQGTWVSISSSTTRTTPTYGLRFLPTTGTITNGEFRLYGVRV